MLYLPPASSAISAWLLLVPLELFASGDPILKPVLGWRDGAVDILVHRTVRIEGLVEIHGSNPTATKSGGGLADISFSETSLSLEGNGARS
jgi:hypothetical protein